MPSHLQAVELLRRTAKLRVPSDESTGLESEIWIISGQCPRFPDAVIRDCSASSKSFVCVSTRGSFFAFHCPALQCSCQSLR